MPIKIDFISNIRDLLRGTKGVEDAFDDVADSLDDVARDGDQSLGRLERSFRDVARNARDASKDVDDVGRKGFRSAGEASAEFKSEALQNLSEVTSSFDGDMQSIGDLAQGTFGGLAASLPGVLGAAGAGAAVGVGLITSAIVAADEARAQLQENANELAQAYIDAGSTALDAMTIASRTAEILTDGDRRKEAEEFAKVLGVDLPTAARALAGDTNALAVANQIASDSEGEYYDLMRQSASYMTGEYTQAEKQRFEQLQRQQDKVRELNEINGIATETFAAQQQVLRGLINDSEAATKEVDELGNELYTLPDGTQIMIDAETGQATTDVKTFKGDVDGIPETVTTRVKVQVDSSAWDNYVPKFKTGVIAANVRVPGRQLIQ